jgi:hypothetical protein
MNTAIIRFFTALALTFLPFMVSPAGAQNPTLAITNDPALGVTVSWPAANAGYSLQWTASLTNPISWQAFSPAYGTPFLSGDGNNWVAYLSSLQAAYPQQLFLQLVSTAVVPAAPSVVTTAAGVNGSTSASLNGTILPNGLDTTWWFQWGLTTNYDNTNSSGVVSGSNTSPVSVSTGVYGLAASTTYHFQLFGSNTDGTVSGGDLTFTTTSGASPPALVTLAATSISSNSAVLNGTIDANGSQAVAHFEYGVDTSYAGGSVGTYFTSQNGDVESFSYTLTGLAPNTTYHYQAFGFNCCLEGLGGDVTFTTTAAGQFAPTVTTSTATSITQTSATINGSINPNGPTATAYFQYSTSPFSPFQGGIATSTYYFPSGNYLQDYSYPLTGLTPNTTYYFIFEASNNTSSGNGALLSFTTTPLLPPTVTTLAAGSVTETTAVLNGSVNPNGGVTTAFFEWGTNTDYGNPTIQTGIGTAVDSDFQASITGLSSSTTYHFRIVAVNSAGTTYGADATFTTAWVPTPPTLIAPGSGTPGAVTVPSLTPTFSWSASSYASDSSLIITKSPYGVGNIVVDIGVGTLSTYQLPSGQLQAGTSYSWYMVSYNILGNPSAASSPYYFKTH